MSSHRVLVVYGTKYGQTAKIAGRIAEHLTLAGERVTLMNTEAPLAGLSLESFDAVVVGASIIGGKHRPSVRQFIERYRDTLNCMPCAFFSVSGSAASSDAHGRAEARRMLDEFLRETVWEPELTVTFGGAMAFTKYNIVLRWFMKRISRRAGGPTDTSRDHDLTDWTQVQRFADAFRATLPVLREAPEMSMP